MIITKLKKREVDQVKGKSARETWCSRVGVLPWQS